MRHAQYAPVEDRCDGGDIVEHAYGRARRLTAIEARRLCVRHRAQALAFERVEPAFAAHCRRRFIALHTALSDLRAEAAAQEAA